MTMNSDDKMCSINFVSLMIALVFIAFGCQNCVKHDSRMNNTPINHCREACGDDGVQSVVNYQCICKP